MFLKKEIFSKAHSFFFLKEKTYVLFIRKIKEQQLLYSHWVKRKSRKLQILGPKYKKYFFLKYDNYNWSSTNKKGRIIWSY